MDDDVDLARRARCGDQRAIEALIAHHHIAVRCLAVRLAPRTDLADDLAQDAFCAAITGLPDFDPEQGTFLQWLRGIVRNLAVQQWRQQARRRSSERDGLAEYVASAALDPVDSDPEALTARVGALRTCLASLAPRAGRLIAMRHQKGMTSVDIGRAIGSEASAVRTALTRIHERLRACLARALGTGLP